VGHPRPHFVNTSPLLASQVAVLSARTCLPITWLGNGRLCIDSHTFATSEHLPTSPTTILLTPYLPPTQALALRQQGINYLDTAGNVFIRATGLCLCIEGQLPAPIASTSSPPVGLRILYHLLSDPQLLQAPYRTLSERAGVALGSVNTFFAELRQQGLVENEQNSRVLDTKALLTHWVQAYGQVRRPQRYRWATPPGIRWSQLPIGTGAYWSGEAAARRLLQEKRSSPTSFILYSHCLPNWGLVPDPVAGSVTILAPPFPMPALTGTSGLAHPLLVYTDLLLAGRDADQGLAQQLHSRYLAHLL
jgi:hypothetical protein